jgi:hypothetical protein
MRPTPSLRTIIIVALFAVISSACGGGTDQAANETTGEATGQTTGATTTPPNEGSGDSSGSTSGGGGTAGANSIRYTISDGHEASGEHDLIPAMTFYDGGVWTFTFGDESGALIVLNLDPSTPSINFTEGTVALSGDASVCDFEVTRQDEDGASGSFDCSDVAMVNAGVLGEVGEFSGSFDANP